MSLEDKLFKQTMKEFPNCEIRDLKEKNVYPYDWMDDYRKFSYPRLPPGEAFYSSLNANQRGKGDGHISIAEHLHAKYIWKKFVVEKKCFKTFKDYHNYYLKLDVLQLADVFENFINNCVTYYQLDPCYYLSDPGLSWDAMLRMSKKRLAKISDSEIHSLIERAKKGGICFVRKRYSKANN